MTEQKDEQDKARLAQFLEIEVEHGDPLSAARGVLHGLIIGLGMWAIIFLLLAWIFQW
jgi:hypothetical protein